MKSLKLLLLVICCFGVTHVSAQNPKLIEADLLKSFKQINTWSDDTEMTANESLWKAKKIVGEKLMHYTSDIPSTISYPFNLLKKEGVDINTSKDGFFRIYSWDTWTGGTMHFFENVFQYKLGNKTYSILDTAKQEGDSCPWYRKVYQLKNNNKTYYLAVNVFIGSTIIYGGAIEIIEIKDRKMVNVNLIKTSHGLNSELSYECDLSKSSGELPSSDYPNIRYNELTKTIFIPFVESNYAVTNKFITYKFTGQYFEKVK